MRRLFLLIGTAVLACVWLGPLPAMAVHTFSAHMCMHMGLVAVAAAFLALGLASGRFDPARRWPALFSPVAASFGELIVVWSWHAPGLHAFARESAAGFVLEQGSFLLVGLWLWLSAFGGGRDGRASSAGRRAAGVAGLLFTSMHMTLLGALLALTPRALYPHMSGGAAMTALEDQHLGGAIMLLVGGIAYLAGGLYLTATLVRSGTRRVASGSPAPAAGADSRGAADADDFGRPPGWEASDAASLNGGIALGVDGRRLPRAGGTVMRPGDLS